MERIGLLPFAKLALVWILGSLLQFHLLHLSTHQSLILLLITGSLSGLFAWFRIVLPPSVFWIKGFVLNLLILSTAITLCSFLNEHEDNKHILNNEYEWALLEITSEPTFNKKSIKYEARAISIKDSTQRWKKANGKVICYLLDTTTVITNGRRLIVSASCIKKVADPTNPNQFNYKAYLANKGIYHQAFIKTEDFHLSHYTPKFSLLSYFNKSRQWMLKNLEFLNTRSKPVAEALLLGYKENLTDDIKNIFSSTGTMHILAVSGLHVGIIYKAVDWLLFFLAGFKHGKKIKIAILLCVLWSYAFITGMPPSVMRASVMFSLVTIGTSLNRPNNIFNNVFASCFLLLVINPRLIYDVGFQLSYLAVLGILVFQPIISKLWLAPNKVLQFIWDLVTVSFAAQLAVAPLTIYYFHQLPLIFPVSNLIAIPGAFLVVVFGGILQLANLISETITGIIQIVYQAILDIIISGIAFLSNFTFANISHLKIDAIALVIMLTLTVVIACMLIYNNSKWVLTALTLILILIWYKGFETVLVKPKLQWVVFDNYKTCAIGVKTNDSARLIFFNASANLSFQSEGWFIEHAHVDTIYQDDKLKSEFIFKEGNIVAMSQQVIAFNPEHSIPKINYYLFSKSYHFENINEFDPSKCIFDSSIKPEWVLKNNPTFASAHFIQRDGAFVNSIE
ncbi:MAG: ComEC family competence protein [Bacteroidia bacterium]